MFHLRRIGDAYANETINPSNGLRQELLGALEEKLAAAIRLLDDAKAEQGPKVATPSPMGQGRVRSLVQFHEQAQANTTRLDRLAASVILLRKWLHRQGARLTRNGKIIWPNVTTRVLYDNQIQQVLSLVRIQHGKLMTIERKPLDTRLMVTHFSGPGAAIFVVSAEGHLHVGSHKVGLSHHSSLLAGGEVACAGELWAIDGQLVKISNKSGHYAPEPFYLAQVLRHFAEQGISPDSYQVNVVFADRSRHTYATGTEFLNATVVPVLPAPAGNAAIPYAYGGYDAYTPGRGGVPRPAGAYSGDDLLAPNPRFSDPSLTVGSKLQGEYIYDIPGL